MAICIDFELAGMNGTAVQYRFGHCLQELSGLLEVDVEKLISGETSWDTPMNEVVILLNTDHSQWMANKVFGKIVKHYKETGEYLAKGGYYA
ncbi:hypothetical protein ACX93W_21975 [Paenibacillus sp. CAU 1782]